MGKAGLQLLTCAAAATVLLPAPALAQTGPNIGLSAVTVAKTEAILGGSHSRLAEIMARQQGLPPPKPLQPAALSAPRATAATLGQAPLVSAAVTSGRPDVFGSVALSVERTPLDKRWRKVANSRVAGYAATYAASLRDSSELARVEAVNRYVNRKVAFVEDSRQYHRGDHWVAANETLRRGRGDCEDYAIAKLQMLRAAGVSDRDLYLVVVKDLVRRSDHAILVVRAAGRMLVLDNGTDVIADTESVRDYRPVLTFAASGVWTHGYRRPVSPVTMAVAGITPLAPSAAGN